MAGIYKILYGPSKLTANFLQPVEQAFDALGYSSVDLQVRVLYPGSAGNILLQESATLDAETFTNIASSSVSVSTGSNEHIALTSLLRYIRVAGDASVAGNPLLIVELIAR